MARNNRMDLMQLRQSLAYTNPQAEIIAFFDVQSNISDSIKYLIEEEVKRNGVRNLQEFIPSVRYMPSEKDSSLSKAEWVERLTNEALNRPLEQVKLETKEEVKEAPKEPKKENKATKEPKKADSETIKEESKEPIKEEPKKLGARGSKGSSYTKK